jgi:hypothetical protein
MAEMGKTTTTKQKRKNRATKGDDTYTTNAYGPPSIYNHNTINEN